jgi:two-component system CheB/CheR fusion protein
MNDTDTTSEVTTPAFEELLLFLKQSRGFDFTDYKRASLMRRVRRRMEDVEIETFEDYRDYLEVHPDEFEQLFNTILINYTGFFRDREAWTYLADEIVPQMLKRLPSYANVRLWSAGCASGEEAYSLAILMAEALGIEACRQRVKIYATDVDEEALAQARQASYSKAAVENVPDDLLETYFERAGDHYVFRSDLRRVLVFGRHDLMQDAPISRLNLLVCRNTLIYFNRGAQRRIITNFHFALKETGYLFLGHAEMLLTHDTLFEPVAMEHRLFRKIGAGRPRDQLIMLAQEPDAPAVANLERYVHLQELAYQATPVALLVLDDDRKVTLINDRAAEACKLQPRDRGRAFQDLEISYRPVELRSVIDRAHKENAVQTLTDVEQTVNGGFIYWDIHVTPLQGGSGEVKGTQLAFIDVTQRHELRHELEDAQQDIQTANEELQSTNEELETSNEELQSTVEELQTTNEELQSTNEEMETMNEELHSANEELQTMNEELRDRTRELDRVNGFLKSILTSVDVGIVVVDRDFDILLWNERAEDLWGLRTDEVVGRSLLSLDIGLPVERLRAPVNAFLTQDDGASGEIVLDAVNRRGRSIAIHITETLRMDRDGDAQGVVLLMEEKERA